MKGWVGINKKCRPEFFRPHFDNGREFRILFCSVQFLKELEEPGMTRTLLEKCEISVSPEERTFLQLAASMTGLSLSAFIRKAAISAAKDAIDKNNHYLLSGNDVGELFSVIDNGFIPNKRLEEAIRLARDIEKNGASHGY